jgi:hypothetical protein
MVCVSVGGVNELVKEALGVAGVGLIAKILVVALSHPLGAGGFRLGSNASYVIVTVPTAVDEAAIVAELLLLLVTVTFGLLLVQVKVLGPMPPETFKVVEVPWQILLLPVSVPTFGTRRTTIGTLTKHPFACEVKPKFTVWSLEARFKRNPVIGDGAKPLLAPSIPVVLPPVVISLSLIQLYWSPGTPDRLIVKLLPEQTVAPGDATEYDGPKFTVTGP